MQEVPSPNPLTLLNSNPLSLVSSNLPNNPSINGPHGYQIPNSNSKLHSTPFKKKVSNSNPNSNTTVLKIKPISLKIAN